MNIGLIVVIIAAALILLTQVPKWLLPKGSTLSAVQAKQWMKDAADLQVIDVRSKPEAMRARIAGSKLIPLPELDSRMGEIDKAKPVLVYCASGGRSSAALAKLLKAGFKAKHMGGGISAWIGESYPVQG